MLKNKLSQNQENISIYMYKYFISVQVFHYVINFAFVFFRCIFAYL